MSSLQTARFASEKGWQRDLSACQRATARALASSSFSPDLSQLVRRVDSPFSHASRPPAKKADFTRNRTRPTTKSHPFPLPKTHTKATGDDGGDFRCAEKKGGKSDPRVRFLVKECVPTLLGSMFSLYQWLLKPYLKPIEKTREAVCLLLLSATCMDSLA